MTPKRTAALAMALALTALASPVAHAADPSPCQVSNITQGTTGADFEAMVYGARFGDQLEVSGTCRAVDIRIRQDLTITGVGEHRAVLDAGREGRVFDVGRWWRLTLRHVEVVRGDTAEWGGGIRNRGTLTLTDSVVEDNTGNTGGGIANNGTLILTDSVVRDNSAEHDAGGIRNRGTLTLTESVVRGNTAQWGGGIANAGTLTLTDSVVRDNRAEWGGGISNRDTLTLEGSIVTTNTAGSQGGGISNGGGTVTLDATSSVTGNTPDDCVGTLAC